MAAPSDQDIAAAIAGARINAALDVVNARKRQDMTPAVPLRMSGGEAPGQAFGFPAPTQTPAAEARQRAAAGRDYSTLIGLTSGIKKAATNYALGSMIEPTMPGYTARAKALLDEAPALIQEGVAVNNQLKTGEAAGDMPATTGYGEEKHRDFQSWLGKVLEAPYRAMGAVADEGFRAKEHHAAAQAQLAAEDPELAKDPEALWAVSLPQHIEDALRRIGRSPFNLDAPTLGDVFRRETEKRAVPVPESERTHPVAKAVAEGTRPLGTIPDWATPVFPPLGAAKLLGGLVNTVAEPLAEDSDMAMPLDVPGLGKVNVSPGRAQAAGVLGWMLASPETKVVGPVARTVGPAATRALAPVGRALERNSPTIAEIARAVQGSKANIRQAADLAGGSIDHARVTNEFSKTEPRANMLLREVEQVADKAAKVSPAETRLAFDALETDGARKAVAFAKLSPEAKAAVVAKQQLAADYLASNAQTMGSKAHEHVNYVEHVVSPEAMEARRGVQTAAPAAAPAGTQPSAAQSRKARNLPRQLTLEATPPEFLALDTLLSPEMLKRVQAADAKYQKDVVARAASAQAAQSPVLQAAIAANPQAAQAMQLAAMTAKKGVTDDLLKRAPLQLYNAKVARLQAKIQKKGLTRPSPIITVPEVNDAIAAAQTPTAARLAQEYQVGPVNSLQPGGGLRVFQEDLGKATVQRYGQAAQERAVAEFLDQEGRQFGRPHVAGDQIPEGWASVRPAAGQRNLLNDVLNKDLPMDREVLIPQRLKELFEANPQARSWVGRLIDIGFTPWKALVTVASGPAYHFRNNAWSAVKSTERFGPADLARAHAEALTAKAGGQGLVQGLPADLWKKTGEEWGNMGMGAAPASTIADLRTKFGLPGPVPEPGLMNAVAARLDAIPAAQKAKAAAKLPGQFAEASDSQARMAAALAEARRITGGATPTPAQMEQAFSFADKFITHTRNRTPLEMAASRVTPFGVWSMREVPSLLGHVLQGGGTLPVKLRDLAEALVPPRAQVEEKYQNERGRQGMAMPTGLFSDAGFPYYLNQPWSAAGVLQPLDPTYRLMRGEGAVAAAKSGLDEAAKFLAPQFSLALQAGLGRRSLTGSSLEVLGKANPLERFLYGVSPYAAPWVVKATGANGETEYKSKGLAALTSSAVPLQQYLRLFQAGTPAERARALMMILGATLLEQDPSLQKTNVKKDWREGVNQQTSDRVQLRPETRGL